MVSADNLNLDVLELIFAFLSGNDLPSVALVSRSFLTGVIPKLYETICYSLRQAKVYGANKKKSPFATILAHPHLAVHVKSVAIRGVPILKSQIHPTFLRDCSQALQRCRNLQKFKCTVPSLFGIVLSSLEDKPRMSDLRVSANLTSGQAKLLPANFKELQTLTLQFASWQVVDVLPRWVGGLKTYLKTLTLYMINDLNADMLKATLSELPGLTGLHVVGCLKADHVLVYGLLEKTPLLESLSFTTTESTKPFGLVPPPLRNLKHLALDTRYSMNPSPSPSILASLLSHLKISNPPLVSFTFKLPERKVVVGDPFISQLVKNHGHTLRRLAFLECSVSHESIMEICKSCIHLERLDLAIPMKEIMPFAKSLGFSKTLRTLVDVENHIEHGIRPSLGMDNARYLMVVCGSLEKVVSASNTWTRQHISPIIPHYVEVAVQRRSPQNGCGTLWFMSRE